MSAEPAVEREPAWRFARAASLLSDGVAAAAGYEAGPVGQPLHRGLPSPLLTFIITLNTPVVTGQAPGRALAGAGASRLHVLASGLQVLPSYIAPSPGQMGVQLSIRPQASRRLLGVPAAELAGTTVDGAGVVGRQVSRLRDMLAEEPDWNARFRLLGGFLRGQAEAAERASTPRAETLEAWRWLIRHRGSGSITALAGHVHLSSRQLHTLFSREFGISPKTLNRLLRFHRAVQLMVASTARHEAPDLAATAAASGYFDQPHLNRDFRAFSGTSPTGWLAEERGNIDAGGHRTGNPA